MGSSGTNEDSRIEGGYEKVPTQDVFVVRYSMSGQGDLAPHNDPSEATTTIFLNNEFTLAVAFSSLVTTAHAMQQYPDS